MTSPSRHFPYETAPTTLYAARGRLIPFNSNSPTGSTFTAFSTFIKTLGLMRDLSRLDFVAEPRGHGFATPGNRYVGRFDYAIKVLKKPVSRVVNRETLSK
jgi:hypothetical protein